MNAQAAHRHLVSARSIGVIRTDRLGDMVCTLPLVDILRREFPSARIHLITRSYCEPLVHDTPVAHEVRYVDRQPLRDILTATHLDAVFCPHPVAAEAWEAARAGIPLRVGSAYRLYSPLFSFRVREHRKESSYHEADYNARMLSAITGRDYTPQLVRPIVRDAARDDIRRLLAERGISGSERIIIIHPAGGGSAPVWPAERFAELAPRLAAEPGTRIVVTGTAAERDECRRVAESDVSVIDLCGCCSLDGMMALCERATLLVANSTGVLHIAAALGTRVVGIFPSTPSMSAKRWGPFAASARTVASGEFAPHTDLDNCSFIPVQRVLDLCTESLSDTLS